MNFQCYECGHERQIDASTTITGCPRCGKAHFKVTPEVEAA